MFDQNAIRIILHYYIVTDIINTMLTILSPRTICVLQYLRALYMYEPSSITSSLLAVIRSTSFASSRQR